MRLLTLPSHLRRWGLTVVEVPGWETRGADFPALPKVVLAHHTATPARRAGDYPSLDTVRDGRGEPNPLVGPLSQVGHGRSGRVYVIAAGKANHAGKGEWAGISSSSLTIGCEGESPGDGTWTQAQRDTAPLLYAALLDLLSAPAEMLCGHKEWALPAGRKIDPRGLDMRVLRTSAALLLRDHSKPPTPPATDRWEFDMASLPTLYEGHADAPHTRRVQLILAGMFGEHELDADGAYGPSTRAAVNRFRARLHLPQTGKVDRPVWAALYDIDT